MANVEGNSGETNLNLLPDDDEVDSADDQIVYHTQVAGNNYSDAQYVTPGEHHGGEPASENEDEDHGLHQLGDERGSIDHNYSRGIDQDDQEELNSDGAEDPNLNNYDDQDIDGNDLEEAAVVAERRWPGWPGESVFRMLVPAQKVGSIIGRKGEFIKRIVEETKARVKILDGPPGTAERVVMVSAKEEPESYLPPAMDGLVRVHKRVVDGLDGDSPQGSIASGKVSTRLLVPAAQAGSLIGKQGGTVKSIQETAGCMVKVLGTEDLPVFALQDDRVVEVTGSPAGVHKAVELIASHLRKFLVDRSIIPMFEVQMSNTQLDHVQTHQQWGTPQGLQPNAAGIGFGGNQYLPQPRQLESFYSSDVAATLDKLPHQGISSFGRESAPLGLHSSSSAPSMITQITQQMQIPLSYADAVIGTAGASISYIRRVSGATVTIQETRGAPGEMTVEISGTASQVQAAQQMIQNFMAEAGAPPQTAAGGLGEQGYNPYSLYSSPPSNAAHGGHSGNYGSAYGTNYGY